MAETWTVRKVLDWTTSDFKTRGLDSPRLDAELLVAEAIGAKRVQLYLDLDRPLVPEELTAIRGLVGRRRAREPIAYILGRRDFHGATFAVDARVLVPRPDTETLVERALAAIGQDAPSRVLDLCTGSGAIPIAILRARPSASATATDVSDDALLVARANAESLGVAERFEARAGDLFEALPADATFDVITANPPYVPSREVDGLMPDVARFEPRLALDGGPDGLTLYPRLVQGARTRLAPGGRLLLEVGVEQAEAVAAMIVATDAYEPPIVTKDYGGVARVVEAALRPR